MKILGIDPGLKCGWSIIDAETNLVTDSGVEDFSKKRGESNGLVFLRFRKWLERMVDFAGPRLQLIVYEQAHHRGGYATELGVGLMTRIQEVAAVHKIHYASVHTATLKKWATGHGHADKELMMKESVRYLGREPVSDDEADSVLIAFWGMEEYS